MDRSLSVNRNSRGELLVHSHCDDDWKACKDYVRDKTGAAPFAAQAPSSKANGKANGNSKANGSSRTVALYDYTDEDGTLLYQVERLDPKAFRQRKPDGNGGYVWKLDGVRRVLYRLPGLLEAVACGKPIFIVEGEKEAHALISSA